MKIYSVEFEPMWPVGGCLIIAANDYEQAYAIAEATIRHTTKFKVDEVVLDSPKVIVYLSGDY